MHSVKTHDTTGDQFARVMLRGINAIFGLFLFALAWPLGIIYLIASIAFIIWNGNRREAMYARNVRYIAAIHAQEAAAQQMHWQATDHTEGSF